MDKQKGNNYFASKQEAIEQKQRVEGVWTMHFDWSINKEGVGAGVYIISLNREFMVYSFKMTFECTNDLVECEALILGLNVLKHLKENRVDVCFRVGN